MIILVRYRWFNRENWIWIWTSKPILHNQPTQSCQVLLFWWIFKSVITYNIPICCWFDIKDVIESIESSCIRNPYKKTRYAYFDDGYTYQIMTVRRQNINICALTLIKSLLSKYYVLGRRQVNCNYHDCALSCHEGTERDVMFDVEKNAYLLWQWWRTIYVLDSSGCGSRTEKKKKPENIYRRSMPQRSSAQSFKAFRSVNCNSQEQIYL